VGPDYAEIRLDPASPASMTRGCAFSNRLAVTVVGSGAPSGRGVASYRLRGPRVPAGTPTEKAPAVEVAQ